MQNIWQIYATKTKHRATLCEKMLRMRKKVAGLSGFSGRTFPEKMQRFSEKPAGVPQKSPALRSGRAGQ